MALVGALRTFGAPAPLTLGVRHMPTYRWSCPACGTSNNPESAQCSACQCPTPFSVKDVVEHRRKFLAGGGSIGPAAAATLDEEDVSVLKVLLSVPLLLLGWWPFGRQKTRESSSNEYV